MNKHGAQSGHDFITGPPHQRLIGKALTRPVDFAQELVCYLR
jgi:hypothetical protein